MIPETSSDVNYSMVIEFTLYFGQEKVAQRSGSALSTENAISVVCHMYTALNKNKASEYFSLKTPI